MEPSFLYGGYPCKGLRHKFLVAQEGDTQELTKEYLPEGFEIILQKLFTDYGLTMNFEQYVLVGSTVRSYLAWLKDTGRLNGLFENNMLLWQRV